MNRVHLRGAGWGGGVGRDPPPTHIPRRVILGLHLFLKKHQRENEWLVRFKIMSTCFFSIYFLVLGFFVFFF